MAKAIRVFIGGKEYLLRGDDEESIRFAATEVNNQLDMLGSKHSGQNNTTLSVLASLNIAEKHYRTMKEAEGTRVFLVNEVNRMRDFLSSSLTDENTN